MKRCIAARFLLKSPRSGSLASSRCSIRLLGDAVLRRVAWKIADDLGWAKTYDAEYLALTQLQADAFVTLDARLARSAEGVVPTATIDALRKRVEPRELANRFPFERTRMDV
jgi:hypothetical protein